jgi:hypothetical protein
MPELTGMVNTGFPDRGLYGFEIVHMRRMVPEGVESTVNGKFTANSIGGIFHSFSPN